MLTLCLFLLAICLAAGAALGMSDGDRHDWTVGAGIVGVLVGVVAANTIDVLGWGPSAPLALPTLVPLVLAVALALVAAAVTFAGATIGGRAVRR
ncbi:MAG: hypothetical protein Q8P18_03925 [Pseudomonadota bacterium]|nr:hypothetical protein [Pseudomonadota bacterium]